MIRTTPFHERTSKLNETGLWEHWSNHLVATRYQMSDKFEYFAVRNSAGLFDTSPLYKYRIAGPDAERFLAGVLARDIRTCEPGHAQYTVWCDDRGFIVEDGVVLRLGRDEFLLTAAEPNLAWFEELVGGLDVDIQEVSDRWAILAVQGPKSRDLLAALSPAVGKLPYFGLVATKIGKVPVQISRTGYTGDLGYEVWVSADDALAVWDAVWAAGRGRGVIPFGLTALYMARIEAGLVLLDVDFHSSRFAWTDADRTTPIELGLGWMFRDLEAGRPGVHRARRHPARDRRQDLALEAQRPGPRLARVRPDLRPGRAHPAQEPRADPGRVLHLRRRAEPARLCDQPDVLADAPAPHRPCPGPPGPHGARVTGQSSSWPSATATNTSTRWSPACPSSIPSEGRPECRRRRRRSRSRRRPGRPTRTARTTRSSSAAVTTASSTAPISPSPAFARSSSSGATSWAARPSPRSSAPASGSRPSPTP